MKISLLVVLVALSVTAVYGYTTAGNRIYDPNGNAVLLRGICRPSLEWSNTGERISESDWRNMRDWGANVIRLTLNQCFWAADANYGTFVDTQVNYIISLGLGVILDLHWSKGTGSTSKCDQQNMPDNDSLTFWSALAAKYKNNPWVIFELYNEPRDVSWSVWRNGGDAGGYQSPGFQKLLDTIRTAGALNAVIVNGLNWAYDLSGVPANALSGSHIIYGTHPYDFGGKQPSDWPTGFGFLTTTYPVIATEFGDYNCNNKNYYNNFVAYANDRDISWTAWGWYPGGCAFPALIDDWNGTPNVAGTVIKNALKGSKIPSGTVTSSTTKAPTTTTKAPSSTTTTKAPASTTAPTTTTKAPTTTSSNPSSTTTKAPATTTKAPSTTQAASSTSAPSSGCAVRAFTFVKSSWVSGVAYTQYGLTVQNTGTKRLKSLILAFTSGTVNEVYNIHLVAGSSNNYSIDLWAGIDVGGLYTDQHGLQASGAVVNSLVTTVASFDCY